MAFPDYAPQPGYLGRLYWAVAWPLVFMWDHADQRAVVSSGLTALALGCFFYARFYYPWAPIGIAALSFAYYTARKSTGPVLLYLAVAAVPIAWIFGAAGSTLWGFGYWDASATLMLWWATMVAVYTMQHTDQVFHWLTPFALIHAAATLYQGAVLHVSRASVLSDSPNVSGGFLALMAIWILSGPFKILAFPLVWAMAFTGSRWSVLVFGVVLLAMMVKRVVSWRLGALLVASTIIISIPFAIQVTQGFRIYPLFTEPPTSVVVDVKRHLANAGADIESRIDWDPKETVAENPEFQWSTPAWLLGIAPMGFFGANDIHSVGIRMIYEVGMIPMALWSLAGLWGLWVKPRFNGSWWALLGFLGLTVLDYYAWMPFTISAIWFVLLAIRFKGAAGYAHSGTLGQHPHVNVEHARDHAPED